MSQRQASQITLRTCNQYAFRNLSEQFRSRVMSMINTCTVKLIVGDFPYEIES